MNADRDRTAAGVRWMWLLLAGMYLLRLFAIARLPLAPEEKVIAYVEARSAEIRAYMASDNPPPMCTVEECWNGKKCQEYCEVKDFCAALGDNPFLRNNPEEKEADSAEEPRD